VNPVVLITVARGRSSLVAHLFARHGLFIPGGKDEVNGIDGNHPFGGYESKHIKRSINSRRKSLYQDCVMTPPFPEFEDEYWDAMRQHGWDGAQQTGTKVDAMCYDVVACLDPHYVVLWRDRETLIDRLMLRNSLKRDNATEVVDEHRMVLHAAVLAGASEVDTDALVHGDDRLLKEAIEGAMGVEYDPGIAARYVRPA